MLFPALNMLFTGYMTSVAPGPAKSTISGSPCTYIMEITHSGQEISISNHFIRGIFPECHPVVIHDAVLPQPTAPVTSCVTVIYDICRATCFMTDHFQIIADTFLHFLHFPIKFRCTHFVTFGAVQKRHRHC
jgi:hypothetical protein